MVLAVKANSLPLRLLIPVLRVVACRGMTAAQEGLHRSQDLGDWSAIRKVARNGLRGDCGARGAFHSPAFPPSRLLARSHFQWPLCTDNHDVRAEVFSS
jgi:hypothetical protein